MLYIQYTGKVRKERREDNNDCDADKRTTAAVAHPSYDIDNSSVEREAEAIFPMHILHKRAPRRSPSLFSFSSARGYVLSREGERTAIFIEARIHGGGSRKTPTVLARRWRYVGDSPLFNHDQNPSPSCSLPPLSRPSAYSYFPSIALYLPALCLVPSRLSEHRHALRGITRRTRVVVIYAACTLVCTYVQGARVRVRANAESQVYSVYYTKYR